MRLLGGLGQAASLLGTVLLLAACAAQTAETQVPTQTPRAAARTAPVTAAPTAAATGAVQTALPTTAATQPVQNALTVWLPPQFDPNSSIPGADKLRQRLEAFQIANPALPVQVRLKAPSGASGMLESLALTSTSARSNLPGLVLLSRPDLESAAARGLISPLNGLARPQEDPDWYTYARQISQVKGVPYGLPLAGDVLVLVYRPARIPTPPVDWVGIVQSGLPVSFAAADAQASLTLQLYLSAGGSTSDPQGRPALQVDVLERVLRMYAEAVKQGVMSGWLATTQNDSQAWQAFRDQRAQWLVTWTSRLLAEAPQDTTVMLIPPLTTQGAQKPQAITLAGGWLLAIPQQNLETQKAAVRLAEELSASEFQAAWSAAAGYLPARPTALAAWPAQSFKAALSQVVLAAQARPSVENMATLEAALLEATLQVIRQQADPALAAQTAADKVAAPPSR